MSRGAEITPAIFSVFHREILEDINEIEISICRLQISGVSEEEIELMESDWLSSQLAIRN